MSLETNGTPYFFMGVDVMLEGIIGYRNSLAVLKLDFASVVCTGGGTFPLTVVVSNLALHEPLPLHPLPNRKLYPCFHIITNFLGRFYPVECPLQSC